MTWVAVARKDFHDAIRSQTLWVVAGLFAVLAVAAAILFSFLALPGSGDRLTLPSSNRMYNLILFLRTPAGWLVPITALLVGYKAIAGERESGSLKLLLSLPHERRDVVLGKIVGRTLVVASAITAGFATAFLIGLVLYQSSSPLLFLAFIAFTVALSTAFVSIAVGFSAFTASASRAAAGAVGTFALFNFVWGGVPNALYLLSAGSMMPATGEFPAWFVFLQRLSPTGAYEGTFLLFQGSSLLQSKLGGPVPFYLSWWFALVILGLWIVLPSWVGYLRFRDADL
ncbi:ABC transporter permease subunit [Halorientalis brevis]|uniref:ABC transporter permease subunit n=1 Tax=Halorientalis brevis TaxID=1126241 RepID=A0ABD6CA65_9EURY|nr:ABC transporter permease subunit [Halorientalis brevis]